MRHPRPGPRTLPAHQSCGFDGAPAGIEARPLMPTRLLRESILDSEAVNSLSLRGEVFYRRLISIVDDFGRFESDISAALEECTLAMMSTGEPLVTVYSAAGKSYLQLNNFNQRTRAQN